MSTQKKWIFFIVLLISAMHAGALYAQSPDTKGLGIKKPESQQKTGKTYALVVGISKYQYPTCYPTLHYADVDAKEFYRYLTNKNGGNVDTDDVVLLLNEQATQGDFWKSFNSIKNRLKKNDNFYIYFSGHGDAINNKLVYLLTYNAPPGNDKAGYFTVGGVVDIHTLKSLIEMITLDENNPANVILITDACRSNELPPGGEAGKKLFYEEMFTKNSGEIQYVSCTADQVSYEDARWGGGRGLFSWHLINGLMGMADNDPEDGIITPSELGAYIQQNVKKDSYDTSLHIAKQVPKYYCPDKKENFTIGHVDKPTKEALAAELKLNKATTGGPAYAVNKGVNLGSEMKKAGYEEQYKKFITAINEGRLVEPADNNAYAILSEILKENIKPELKSDLKFELSSSLMNDVTKVINDYLHASTNNNAYTYKYFMTAAKKLRAFQTISDTLYYSQLDVKVNLLFLEGHSNWLSTKTYEIQACLKKADSAIALKPNAAYLYYLKGLLHMQLKEYKEALIYERRTAALAPKWTYPLNDIGVLYSEIGKMDSALIYLFRALAIDTNDHTHYSNIAWTYSKMGKLDSAKYYHKKGLTKDAHDQYNWYGLGNVYSQQKKWDSALYCYYQGIESSNTFYQNYEGALLVHVDNYKSSDSIKYYVAKMIASDSTNPVVYNELGAIFQKHDLDTNALQMYLKSIAIDSMKSDTWYSAYTVCKKMKQYELAEKCLVFAISIDSTAFNDGLYNTLGNFYYERNSYTKALNAFANAIRINPDRAVYYSNYAFVSAENKDIPTAEKYYRKAIKADPKYYSAYYDLSKILAAQSKNKESLKLLEIAINSGEYSRKDIEAEKEFSQMKETKEFKDLVSKAK